MKKVGLIMGSDSDLPVVKKAAAVLEELGIPYEAHVYSAHRTPAEARAFCCYVINLNGATCKPITRTRIFAAVFINAEIVAASALNAYIVPIIVCIDISKDNEFASRLSQGGNMVAYIDRGIFGIGICPFLRR